MERADFFVKIAGHILADVGVDGDLLAAPAVNAEADVSKGLLDRKDNQCLDFTVVDVGARADIEKAAGTTYMLGFVSRDLNGGSIDRDGEDSADDGEKLCGEHQHGVG